MLFCRIVATDTVRVRRDSAILSNSGDRHRQSPPRQCYSVELWRQTPLESAKTVLFCRIVATDTVRVRQDSVILSNCGDRLRRVRRDSAILSNSGDRHRLESAKTVLFCRIVATDTVRVRQDSAILSNSGDRHR